MEKMSNHPEHTTLMEIIRCVEYQVLVPELHREAKQSVKDLRERLQDVLGVMKVPAEEPFIPNEESEGGVEVMEEVIDEGYQPLVCQSTPTCTTSVIPTAEPRKRKPKKEKKDKKERVKKLKLNLNKHIDLEIPETPAPPPTPQVQKSQEDIVQEFLNSICPTQEELLSPWGCDGPQIC
jgi:hypothetical protein